MLLSNGLAIKESSLKTPLASSSPEQTLDSSFGELLANTTKEEYATPSSEIKDNNNDDESYTNNPYVASINWFQAVNELTVQDYKSTTPDIQDTQVAEAGDQGSPYYPSEDAIALLENKADALDKLNLDEPNPESNDSDAKHSISLDELAIEQPKQTSADQINTLMGLGDTNPLAALRNQPSREELQGADLNADEMLDFVTDKKKPVSNQARSSVALAKLNPGMRQDAKLTDANDETIKLSQASNTDERYDASLDSAKEPLNQVSNHFLQQSEARASINNPSDSVQRQTVTSAQQESETSNATNQFELTIAASYASSKIQKAHLSMSDGKLGEIVAKIESGSTSSSLTFITDSQEIRHELTQQMGHLKELFSQSNLSLSSADVQYQPSHKDSQPQSQRPDDYAKNEEVNDAKEATVEKIRQVKNHAIIDTYI